MTGPRTCSQCGAIPVRTKGLCGPCYQRERNLDHPEIAKPSLRLDRTAYLEELAARDHAWRERCLDIELMWGAGSKMDHAPDVWMTYTEAAVFWDVAYVVAAQRIRSRRMPIRRVGRQVLVQRAAVEAYRSRAPVSLKTVER